MSALSENGWPVLTEEPAAAFTAPNGTRCPVASWDVATVLSHIAWRWHREIEPVTYCKSMQDRRQTTIIGTSWVSNHESGTAMDINPARHPYEARCIREGREYVELFTPAQAAKLREIAQGVNEAGAGYVVRLGIDYRVGIRDGMHVEIHPRATEATINRAARGIRAMTEPDPKPEPKVYTVRPGDSPWSIATAHDLSLADLAALNDAPADWRGVTIHPGDVLIVA